MTTRCCREQEATEMETRDTRDTRNNAEAGSDAGTTVAGDTTTAGGATHAGAHPAESPDRASPRGATAGRAARVRKPRPRRKCFVL
jgi:hypothetical protein